jgi:hypothetical protein
MQRIAKWRITQPGIIISLAILAFCFWQLSYHSQYWAGEPLSVAGMFLYMGVTVLVGSIFGLLVGLAIRGIARAFGRRGSSGFRLGYFIGLDITVVLCMWFVPAMS